VETDNIDLDAAEKEWQQAANQMEGNPITEPSTTKLTLRYEDYVRVSNLLVYQLRRIEAIVDTQEEESTDEPSGMTKSSLLEWYMSQIENELQTEEDFHQRRREVSAVVERLVHKDGVLIELGVRREDSAEFDPILVVHPNYVPL
jgi:DNA replication licensing factor MCM6